MSNIGYVDLTYADDYISKHYLSTDEIRNTWENLDEVDKEILLRKSFEAIESLPFTGHRYYIDQSNAFPRCPNEEVPEAIKAAQIENALALSDNSTSEDIAFYEKLRQFGIGSYSIGNLSESLNGSANLSGSMASYGIFSSVAVKLLRQFISGSYNIRGMPK